MTDKYMELLKILYKSKRLCDAYPYGATRFQTFLWRVREFLKKLLRIITIGAIGFGALYGSFSLGAYFNPVITYATQEKIVYQDKQVDYPVMNRIAKCESGNTQMGKNGQVILNANTNDTVDVGKYQINNTVWGKKATELGYDLMTEEGNTNFAMWLYQNHGTEPWYSSASCWNK